MERLFVRKKLKNNDSQIIVWAVIVIIISVLANRYSENIYFDIAANILLLIISIDKELFVKFNIHEVKDSKETIVQSAFAVCILAIILCSIAGIKKGSITIHFVTPRIVFFQILVAFAEEIAFRYKLLNYLIKKINNELMIIILNSGFFAIWHYLIHYSIFQLLFVLFFLAMLTTITEKTNAHNN